MHDQSYTGHRIAMTLLTVFLIAMSGVGGVYVARWLRSPAEARPETGSEATKFKFPSRIFEGWKKPDVVLVISGQQYGYLLPCGCSDPQIGGLERRYKLVQMIKAAGWPVVPMDLGDVPQTTGPVGLPNQQGVIKYVYAMKAMEKIGYIGVGLGRHEAGFGLLNLLSEYSLNNEKPPVLISNLIDADKNLPGMTKPWFYADTTTGVRVGVTNVIGPREANEMRALDPSVRFGVTPETLDNILGQMKKGGVNLPVLMYQGPLGEAAKPSEARACAAAYPQFPIVVCLSEHEEPDLRPTVVPTKAGGNSLLIQAGKKGKYVVAVGAWKTETGFDFKYERIEMTPDFKEADDKRADNPIVQLMEQYTAELKAKDYLGKYGQRKHPLQVLDAVKNLRNPGEPQYIGSEACKKCHEDAYDIWKKSGHSHAYDTLVNAKNPGNRQFDPECIVCHTIGFGYQTGFVDAVKTPKFKDVGCESCHGPASLHARNPNDVEWQKRVNPWRHMPVPRDQQLLAIDLMCQKCHDQENDVHWTGGGFKRKWPKVEHPSPKAPGDEK